MKTASILVVEDDAKIAKVMEHVLRREGHQVQVAPSGENALECINRRRFELIVLDLNLPGVDGFEVCRQVRAGAETPIIVVSARTEEVDKVVGFSLGADDYLTKPFSPTEMVLRVRAILRRAAGHPRETPVGSRLEVGGLIIDQPSRTVIVRGNSVELTAKEFDLLFRLASRPNQVFTRDQLVNLIWDSPRLGDPESITVLIRRLREKVEEDPSDPQIIRTVWGVGYKFIG